MRTFLAALMYVGGGLVVGAAYAPAQDWTTGGYDAQRSSWVRSDAKISLDNLRKPGFQLLWKVNAGGASTPVLLDLLIGHRGFRALAFVGGKADQVLAVDTDLGRTEWERRFPSLPPRAGSPACAGGLTPSLARPTNAAVPATAYGGGHGGQAARSAVGEPGHGAVTLVAALRRSEAGGAPRPAPVAAPGPSRPRPSPHPFPVLYALASDGALYTLNVMDGSDADPPLPFLPPHAAARGLIVVDDVAYVVTDAACGTAPAAVWALDLGSKQVTTRRATGAIAGTFGPAIGPDGTIYVATTRGELQALDPRSLAPQGAFRAGGPGFTSSPVIFEQSGSTLIAAASRDGRIHLVDGSRLASVMGPVGPTAGLAAGAAVSWADSSGTRWLLAAAGGSVVAWKVIEQGGERTLQPGWTSRDMISPLTPLVINGVVFAVSSGPSGPSVLYALNGATGRELWNSGTAIAGVARGGLSGESGQVYVGTSDGTLYAFGFPMEH